jgi:hypothetical protein
MGEVYRARDTRLSREGDGARAIPRGADEGGERQHGADDRGDGQGPAPGSEAAVKAFDPRITASNPSNMMKGDAFCIERFVLEG